MKAVALILALAVITGCNARAVRQADATVPNWQEGVDRFWTYISDLNQKADGVVQELKDSQLSRELDTLITDTMAELTTYADGITANLPPYTDVSTGQLIQDLQVLVTRVNKDMLDAKERSTEYLGELKTMVEQNTDDVRGRFTTYTNKLKKRLNKDTEEIRNTVSTYLGEVQSRASENLGTVRGHVEQASESAHKRLSDLSTVFKSQAEGLGKQLEDQAEGLKSQLEVTAEELTKILSQYIDQIREQFEGIVPKVKEIAAQ